MKQLSISLTPESRAFFANHAAFRVWQNRLV